MTTINKNSILELLAKEDVQVLSLAYLYASNCHKYGVDVTKAACTAVEMTSIVDKAYVRGCIDAERKFHSSRDAKLYKRAFELASKEFCDFAKADLELYMRDTLDVAREEINDDN